MTTATYAERSAIPATPALSNRINAGLAFLRVVIGTIFIVHGAQKLFVFGLSGVTASFSQMGIPLAEIAGPAVALLEFFGGIALVLGFFTRIVALGLAANMLGAIFLVHLPSGFFAPNGIEFPLALMGGAIALALIGPGRWSIHGARSRS